MITDGTSRRPAVKNLADRADRTPGLLLGITMAMGLVFLLFASPYTTPLNPYYGYDSAVFMVLGKGVAAGKLPYLDLYDNKGPMIFYINALGYLLGGPDGGFLPPGGVYGPVPGAAVPAGPAVHGYPPGPGWRWWCSLLCTAAAWGRGT